MEESGIVQGVLEGRPHMQMDLTDTAESRRGQLRGLHSMILFLYGIEYAKPYFTLFVVP